MRGRAIAVSLLVTLLLFPDAAAQCNFTPVYSAQHRSSYLDVAVDGSDLWAATSYGLQLFDRTTDPPTLVSSLPLAGVTRVVRVAGGVGYAGSGTSVMVVRKNGRVLELIRSLETGAQVNDIAVTPLAMYVATSNGLQQYELPDPFRPVQTPAVFPTSSPNVTSISISGTTLYVADGDNTVEVFETTAAQRTGSIESLPRSSAVEVIGNRLLVSDGMQTDIVLRTSVPPVRVARLPFGATSLALLSNDVVFLAGNDRRLRAVDLAVTETPIELYATEISPSGGNINRFSALVAAASRLYAAAGDGGLLSFDISAFTAPFPVRSYTAAPATSVFSLGGKVYSDRAGGGISEFSLSPNGALTATRQWDTRPQIIHDGENNFLLTSSGATLLYWTVAPITPVLVSSATLPRAVKSAVIVNHIAYAIADDGTLWTADLLQVSPAPQQITTIGGRLTAISRSGSALAMTDLRPDGSTRILYFARPEFTSGITATVAGAATAGVALSGTRAAVSTFAGLTVIDFSTTGATTLLAPSPISKLIFSGALLYALDESTFTVWDPATKARLRHYSLPVPGLAVHISDTAPTNVAAVATSNGVTTVLLNAASQLPRPIPSRLTNAYYRKVVSTTTRLYLFDGRDIEIYETPVGIAPNHISTLRVLGTVDFAASDERIFTLSNLAAVASYGRDGGSEVARTTIDEGSNTMPLAITVVRGAPWVSISRGCLTTGCEKRTLVFDPSALVRTAVINGGTIEVIVSGTRAYAITDLPAEVRVYDVANPLHPSQIASRPAEGSQPPASIAHGGASIYVLGERLHEYDVTSLAKKADLLDPLPADPSQRVVTIGDCVVISGRAFSPQFFNRSPWTTLASQPFPASTRSLAQTSTRLYFLTDYSLEIWSSTPAAPAGRRRTAR